MSRAIAIVNATQIITSEKNPQGLFSTACSADAPAAAGSNPGDLPKTPCIHPSMDGGIPGRPREASAPPAGRADGTVRRPNLPPEGGRCSSCDHGSDGSAPSPGGIPGRCRRRISPAHDNASRLPVREAC